MYFCELVKTASDPEPFLVSCLVIRITLLALMHSKWKSNLFQILVRLIHVGTAVLYASRYTITLSGFPAPYLGIYKETLNSKSSANPEQEKRIIIKALYFNANCISTADIWFINQVHQALMIITALLTVTGVAFAFIYIGHWSEVITTKCNFTMTNYRVVRK